MASDLPTVVSGLVTLWAATLLYGINVVLFIICLWVLVRGRRRGYTLPWVIFIGIWCQFILSTVHMAMIFSASVQVFLTVQTTVAALVAAWGVPFDVYTEIQQVVYSINNLIGDIILIWRLFVVYELNWYVIILPLSLALAAGGCNIYADTVIIASPATLINNFEHLQIVVTAGFSMTAAVQLIVTILIAGKIIRWSRVYLSGSKGVAWMLVESGATLAVSDVLFLAFQRSTTFGNASALVLAINGQLCAIVPLTIIVRVGITRAAELTAARKSTNGMPLAFLSPPGHSTWNDSSTSPGVATKSAGTTHLKGASGTDLGVEGELV